MLHALLQAPSHYVPRHAKASAQSPVRRRVAGAGVTGIATIAATIAAGIATGSPAHADGSVWDRVAACESGGNWSISTGNGFYGGLQFTHSTWIGYGGGRYASNANGASRSAQIAIAQRVLGSQGPGAWPVCSVRAGLTRSNGGSSSAPAPVQHTTAHYTVHHATVHHTTVHHAAVQHTVHHATVHHAPVHHTSPSVSRHVVRHAVTHYKAVNTHRPAVHYSSATGSGRFVTVRSGDWLSKLAATYQVRGGWQALWSVNRTTVSNPNLIFVGQRLQLPR